MSASLPSTRQHPSYGDCLEVKREYCQNCSMLCCVTQCSQSASHSCEQFQQIGFVTLGSLHHVYWLYYCNMVEWSWWDSVICKTNWFPSVLWHCWFGHMTCKNRPRVWRDVKPCSINAIKWYISKNYILWTTFLSQTVLVYLQPLWRNRPQKLLNSVK